MGMAAATALWTTRAKSWSSADALLGTPSELRFAAVTMTAKAPVTPAGRNTLSTLLRGSAVPPGSDDSPLKTLPR